MLHYSNYTNKIWNNKHYSVFLLLSFQLQRAESIWNKKRSTEQGGGVGELTTQHNGFSRFTLAFENNRAYVLTIVSLRDEEFDSNASSSFVKPPIWHLPFVPSQWYGRTDGMNITDCGPSLLLQTIVTADKVIVDDVAANVMVSSPASLSRQKQSAHRNHQ